MKIFSSHHLLQSELKSLPLMNHGWFDRVLYKLFKNIDVEYTLSIPTSTYLRAEAFCDDVVEISELYFDQRDLLSLLYDGFLHDVRKIDDVQQTYAFLSMAYDLYTRKTPVKISNLNNHPDKDRFPSFLMKNEEIYENYISLSIKLTRKKALRGEILLADMDELFPDHPFTLEKILQILLCDFIEEYKKGNHKNVMKKIIKNLQES